MSALGTFIATGVGGVAGAMVAGEISRSARGYALPDELDEVVGAVLGGAIFAAVVTAMSKPKSTQESSPQPLQQAGFP